MVAVVDLPVAFMQTAQPCLIDKFGWREIWHVVFAAQSTHRNLMKLRQHLTKNCLRYVLLLTGVASKLLSKTYFFGLFHFWLGECALDCKYYKSCRCATPPFREGAACFRGLPEILWQGSHGGAMKALLGKRAIRRQIDD